LLVCSLFILHWQPKLKTRLHVAQVGRSWSKR